MKIISSLTDIRNYVADMHSDMFALGLGAALADAIQEAAHPPYGQDWSEWLDANIAQIRDTVSESAS